MNISKILAAGILASSLSFADQAPSLNSKTGVGLHGNFEYNKLYGLAQDWDMGDDTDAPAGIGFDIGVRGRIPMTQFIQFTPELNFRYAKLSLEDDDGFEFKFKQIDLEVPLMIRAIVFNRAYLAAGVEVGLNLSSKVSIEEDDVDLGYDGLTMNVDIERDEVEHATVNFGLAFGAGVYIIDRLSVDAGIHMGLSATYPDGKDVLFDLSDGKQLTFRFGVGYWIL